MIKKRFSFNNRHKNTAKRYYVFIFINYYALGSGNTCIWNGLMDGWDVLFTKAICLSLHGRR